MLSRSSLLTAGAVILVGTPAVAQRERLTLSEVPLAVLGTLRPESFDAHWRFLADDLMEGRAPGTRGGDLAAHYIAAQFEALGLRPAWPSGYLQWVPLVASRSETSLVIGAGRRTIVFDEDTDFVAWPLRQEEAIVFDADLVFGGYGIDADEWGWDDFQGRSVAGKILLVRSGEPPRASRSPLQGGATRYGRWSYKVEQAQRAGAVGILLIHSAEAGVGPWSAVQATWGREVPQPERAGSHGMRFAAWITADVARRIVEATGMDYDLLMRRADVPGFRAIEQGARAAVDIRSRFRSFRTPNVVGVLPGSEDTGAASSVYLVAHYDHFGIGPSHEGDSIYNGAVDNASGVAALLTLARGLAAAPNSATHTLVFAATTAGEYDMAGAAALAAMPPTPLDHVACVIALHEMNAWGMTRDIIGVGADLSTIGPVAREAARLEELALADPATAHGDLYDSDQFVFARLGVPVVVLRRGQRAFDDGRLASADPVALFRAVHRHRPTDEIAESMSPDGVLQQVRVLARVAWHFANAPTLPNWLPTSEFGGLRRGAPAR